MNNNDNGCLDSTDDCPCEPPAIITCDKTKKYAKFIPIPISETKCHNKRLSFVPMIVPNNGHGKLRGHLIYEPLAEGKNGYEPIKGTEKISKKDVTVTKNKMIDLELSCNELETLIRTLNKYATIAEKKYEDVPYYLIKQLPSLDELHQILSDNWRLRLQEPTLYKLLLFLTESSNKELSNQIADLFETIEKKSALSNKPLKSKLIYTAINSLPDLTLEDLKTIVPLITDKEKTLIKQYLNIEELKQFIKELKSSVDSDKDEKYWQNIITQNNWVLSQLFPYPFVFHGDKVHIGGQTLEKEGGICDFLVKNEITSNVSLIEIKANTDQLVNNQPYRKGLNTYSMSDNVIGGVVQLLDYKNTLMAHSIQPNLDMK